MSGPGTRGWVGWITENRVPTAGMALALVLLLIGIGTVVARSGGSSHNKKRSTLAAGPIPTVEGGGPVETTTTVAGPGVTAAPGATTPAAAKKSAAANTAALAKVPGLNTPGFQCQAPAPDSETGVTNDSVTIGQIVSDVSALPAQLKPNYYGLQAYVKLVNDAGGLCGRKIVLKYSNDGSNPATHDYAAMTHQVFSFVANSSLIDTIDYQSDTPFNPNTQDKGEFVPDIGGLAYSYGRNQSQWFAGTVGSLSPSLTGGANYKYMLDEVAGRLPGVAASPHGPCRKAGILYLREPTGASEDQGKLGQVALAAPWGGNLGAANVKLYVNNLADPVPVYEGTVAQMVADGVNCAFTFSDLGSDINLVLAMKNRGVWPPNKCSGPTCFSVVYVPFAAYDPKFIHDGGDASFGVTTFLPHIPLNERSLDVMQTYLKALDAIPGATPSTFSLIGFLSGEMFSQGFLACGAAPTRACVMDYARKLTNFDGAGLLGAVTPFRSTRVDCSGGCGNFGGHGTYNFKWIFTCNVTMRVADRGGTRDFFRISPQQGYTCDTLQVARGKPG